MKDANWSKTWKKGTIAAAVILAVLMTLCMAIAWTVEKEWLKMKAGKDVIAILLGVIIFGSCYWAANTVPKYKLPTAMTAIAIVILVLLLMKLICWNERPFLLTWRCFLPILSALVAGIAGAGGKRRYRKNT